MNKLTQKIAAEYVRRLGGKLVRNVEWNEYIVKANRAADGTWDEYYSDNLEDAIQSAKAWLGGDEGRLADADAYLNEQVGSAGQNTLSDQVLKGKRAAL